MTAFARAALSLSLALAALCVGCRSAQTGLVPTVRAAPRASLPAADQANAPLLPDASLTPGATLPVTRDDICVPGYSQKVRNVPQDVKNQAYAEYGIASHAPGEYEVDHLISLELGGSNSLKNLWPQSYRTQPWNAHVKDKLENELHASVCRGDVPLPTAQHDIATDWIAAYKKYFHASMPLSASPSYSGRSGFSPHPLTGRPDPFGGGAPTASSGAAPAAGQVWVNLGSGKYFRPGSKYYGHTKRGEYLSESAARQQGYVAARGQ